MEKGTNPDSISGGFISTQGPGDLLVRANHSQPTRIKEASTPQELEVVKLKRKARSTKLAIMGVRFKGWTDPDYINAVRMAASYRKKRAQELSELHGHVSAGASALLATASLALAASRFLYQKFGDTGGGDLGVGMLQMATRLGDSARQSELAAWEVSAREGLVKRKLAAQDQGVPWLTRLDEGQERLKGRKSNNDHALDMVVDQSETLRSGEG